MSFRGRHLWKTSSSIHYNIIRLNEHKIMGLKCQWNQALSTLRTLIQKREIKNRQPYPLRRHAVTFHLSSSPVISSNSSAPINEDSRIFIGDVQRPRSKIHPTSSNVTGSTSGRHPTSFTDIVPGNERKTKEESVSGRRYAGNLLHAATRFLPALPRRGRPFVTSRSHPSIHISSIHKLIHPRTAWELVPRNLWLPYFVVKNHQMSLQMCLVCWVRSFLNGVPHWF